MEELQGEIDGMGEVKKKLRCSRGHTWEVKAMVGDPAILFRMGDKVMTLNICFLCLGDLLQSLVDEGKIGTVEGEKKMHSPPTCWCGHTERSHKKRWLPEPPDKARLDVVCLACARLEGRTGANCTPRHPYLPGPIPGCLLMDVLLLNPILPKGGENEARTSE